MRFFDLHCDTVLEIVRQNKSFYNNSLHIDLNKIQKIDEYIQFMAFFIPNNSDKETIMEYFEKGSRLINELDNKKVKFIASIENSTALMNNVENLELYKKYNIKMASLTWNKDNELGSGTYGTNFGITEFGKKVLAEFDKNNITIDVSHASEKLFWDICENTESSIVASHSNSFSVCQNERNLKDEQIKEIVKRKGLIGLNFHRNFLNNDFEKASVKDILIHAEEFLSQGCENVLAVGSDFDGADMPKGIKDISSIPSLFEEFLNIGYSEELVDKIFYKNAKDYFNEKFSLTV